VSAQTEADRRGTGEQSSLADVLPAAAAALGLDRLGTPRVCFPPARVVVVLLIDGLGDALLAERSGHAPFLRQLRGEQPTGVTSAGFPSTTVTSLGMLGTGQLPGGHGLVGVDVLDPARDQLFNELAWDAAVDPRAWQPEPTMFEQVASAGLECVRIGPSYFDGSGLTEAVLRGGSFVAAAAMQARVDAAVEAAERIGSGLVYVYWGEVDKVGHVCGSQSWQWGDELTVADQMAQRLAARLPQDCLLVVTADHGMVDVPMEDRVDIAFEPDLAAGIRHLGGEARAVHLYCEPGAADDVLAVWRERLGDQVQLVSRDEAVRGGWFGPVRPRVLPRIGDVVGSAVGRIAVVDSRRARPETLKLLGLHGARTDQERRVPLLLAGPAADGVRSVHP
jgi:hypothetical protein